MKHELAGIPVGGALVITSLKQANHGVLRSASAADTPLIELSELADRETLAAAAHYACDPRFSYQWRRSLTTILRASAAVNAGKKSH